MSAKRALTRFRAPDEAAAEERAWSVVRTAFQERTVARHRTPYRWPALAFVAAVLAGALALSPAGATVGRLITRALGVQHATPALFSLPSPGRLLVAGQGGTWTVASDGSTRRLGPWADASWSPHGLYLTVAGANELAAVNPRGVPQWTLGRPRVSDPRWYSPTGYRVAYLSGHDLRVVAGDGTGDHLLAGPVAPVAPAWRPGHPYQLAYLTAPGRLVMQDGDTGETVWSSARPGDVVRELAWSADGQRLLAVSPQAVLVYSGAGRLLESEAAPGGGPLSNAALSPDGRMLVLESGGASNAVTVENVQAKHPAARRVLAGSGLGQVAWSPDGRWLLITWPVANQWVFVRVVGTPRILAVSRIAQQFSAGASTRFPRLEGWCCSAAGGAG